MAEIRSTMDMVMERAAKMAAESSQTTKDDSVVKEGMKIAAEYLNTGENSISTIIQDQKQEKRKDLVKGIGETLLRNIVLPRDERLQEISIKALSAIADLAPPEASSVCAELQQILGQYNQHKEQMLQQLEDAIKAQLEQKLEQQGTKLTDDMSINPTMHPQYQEELSKMLTDLNGQYNQALDQRKDALRQSMAGV